MGRDKIASIIVIALNEEKYLDKLLESIKQQSYAKKLTEIVFVDGGSTDLTQEKFFQFKKNNIKEYMDIQILQNDKKIQAAGRNLGMKAAKGDIFFHVDAHSFLTKDFVENAIRHVEEGYSIVGSICERVSLNQTLKSRLILDAENAVFGSSVGAHKKTEISVPLEVDTTNQLILTRQVYETIGVYNEKYLRAEDNDYSFRIRSNGFKIIMFSDVKSFYFVRDDIKGMLKQKFNNGKWITIAAKSNIKMFSLYHFIPLLFFLSLCASIALGVMGLSLMWKNPLFLIALIPLFLIFVLYGFLDAVITLKSIINEKKFSMALVFFIFPLMHICYGIGSFYGFFIRGQNED